MDSATHSGKRNEKRDYSELLFTDGGTYGSLPANQIMGEVSKNTAASWEERVFLSLHI